VLLTPPPTPPGDPPPCPVPLPADAPRDRNDAGRFEPGNKIGGRKGPNKATILLQTLFETGAAEIGGHVLTAIKRGDMTAARIAMDRIFPVRRGSRIEIPNFPKVEKAADVPVALAALLDAVTAGIVTADEAKPIADLLSTFVVALETTTLAERLAALEALQPGSKTRGY
jgi:hypothetical protein